jgi:hypothetical protein
MVRDDEHFLCGFFLGHLDFFFLKSSAEHSTEIVAHIYIGSLILGDLSFLLSLNSGYHYFF